MPLFQGSFGAFNNSLFYGLSKKKDGSMGLAVHDENRQAFFTKLGIDENNVVAAQLVHGTNIVVSDERERGRKHDADGLMTTVKGRLLTITVGDCVPIFAYAPSISAIALVHAGWRGISDGIVASLAEKVQDHLKTPISKFFFGLGPCIKPCHYIVDSERAEFFRSYRNALNQIDDNQYKLDLSRVVFEQLKERNVPENRIEISKICTFEDAERFFSHRREKKEKPNVMLAFLSMKK